MVRTCSKHEGKGTVKGWIPVKNRKRGRPRECRYMNGKALAAPIS